MKTQDRAYVLRRRPYRDTSLLVDFFTEHHGVIVTVCRGVRQAKKKVPLEGFRPFWIEYAQRHNLAALYQYESEIATLPITLIGNALYCALYLNELLTKLLGHYDPYPKVFAVYQDTLQALSQANTQELLEIALRKCEFFLLSEIGYGIAFDHVQDGRRYDYDPHRGFVFKQNLGTYEGSTLLSIAQSDFSTPVVRKAAKQIIRQTWDYLLKHNTLKTRDFYLYCPRS